MSLDICEIKEIKKGGTVKKFGVDLCVLCVLCGEKSRTAKHAKNAKLLLSEI